MTTTPPDTCDFCGRLVVPGQSICACGSRLNLEGPDEGDDVELRDFSPLLPAGPTAGLVWLIYLIFNPGLLAFTGMPVFKAYAVTALASAAVAILTANNANRKGWPLAPTPFGNLTPVSWFFVIILLWPAAFPLFVMTYLKRNNPVRMNLTLVTSGLFLVTLLWVIFVTAGQIPGPPSPAQAVRMAPPPSTSQPSAPETTPLPEIPRTITSPDQPAQPVVPSAQPTSAQGSVQQASPPSMQQPQAPPQGKSRAAQRSNMKPNSNQKSDMGVDILRR